MTELARGLRRLNATAMVIGTIIGASIFVQPAEIARQLDSPPSIMLAWIACGVLTLFGAFVCAELAFRLSADRRRLRLPSRSFLTTTPVFSGDGRCSGASTQASSPPSRSSSDATQWYSCRHPSSPMPLIRAVAVAVIVALSALNYVGAGSDNDGLPPHARSVISSGLLPW